MKSWYNMLFCGVSFIFVGALVTKLDQAKFGEPYFRVLNFDGPVLPERWPVWTETFSECKALPDLVKIGPRFTSGVGINEDFEDQYFRYPNLMVLFSLMKGLFKLKLSVIVKLFFKD